MTSTEARLAEKLGPFSEIFNNSHYINKIKTVLVDPGGVTGATPDLIDLTNSLLDATTSFLLSFTNM